eukprot:4204-Heterococcus_DN1.PRE.2
MSLKDLRVHYPVVLKSGRTSVMLSLLSQCCFCVQISSTAMSDLSICVAKSIFEFRKQLKQSEC